MDNLSLDVSKMQQAKTDTVMGLTGGIEYLLKKNKVDYVHGKATLSGPNHVTVHYEDDKTNEPKTLNTKHILIATGSEVTPLPPVPVDQKQIVDSTGALEFTEIPKTLAVIGGGVIGLELGSVWSRLGSKVTVIEFLDRLCPSMDLEVTKQMQRIFKKQGFNFKFQTKVTKSQLTDKGVTLIMESGTKSTAETYEKVLVATGRRPYTNGLGLEELGIQTDRLGRIQVDKHFQTAVPSIWAIGDCINGPMLAHKAEEEGIAAVEMMAGYAGHVNYDAIPGKACDLCTAVYE
jgi:dihydrolipoamide dehydrogenase